MLACATLSSALLRVMPLAERYLRWIGAGYIYLARHRYMAHPLRFLGIRQDSKCIHQRIHSTAFRSKGGGLWIDALFHVSGHTLGPYRCAIPDMSRVGGVHRPGIQGRRRPLVPQALDHGAFGSLRRAPRGNSFGGFCHSAGGQTAPGPMAACCTRPQWSRGRLHPHPDRGACLHKSLAATP